MSKTQQGKDLVKHAGRVALGPLVHRFDQLRADVDRLQAELDATRAQQGDMAAALEQAVAANGRLEAYFDRYREELQAELVGPLTAGGAGSPLDARFEHGIAHADAVGEHVQHVLGREIADLRSTARISQALMERVLEARGGADQPGAAADPGGAAPITPGPTRVDRVHPTPSMDLLYRAFEDRFRGAPEAITDLQRTDYFHRLRDLPNPELPIADLGCGRGELVNALADEGLTAIGVDTNLGQIVGGDTARFVEDDLFAWLDAQDDASLRAVVAMHVVEHLPVDLQIRLVFEARRVVADGGLLILETPNATSIRTAASNFWLDPTHERPVHPLFLQFLATQAGFAETELVPLHPIEPGLPDGDSPELRAALTELILGAGDIALVAQR